MADDKMDQNMTPDQVGRAIVEVTACLLEFSKSIFTIASKSDSFEEFKDGLRNLPAYCPHMTNLIKDVNALEQQLLKEEGE